MRTGPRSGQSHTRSQRHDAKRAHREGAERLHLGRNGEESKSLVGEPFEPAQVFHDRNPRPQKDGVGRSSAICSVVDVQRVDPDQRGARLGEMSRCVPRQERMPIEVAVGPPMVSPDSLPGWRSRKLDSSVRAACKKRSSGNAAGWQEGGSSEGERKAYRGHDHRPDYTLTASTTYHIGCCSTVAPKPACNSIFSAARGV